MNEQSKTHGSLVLHDVEDLLLKVTLLRGTQWAVL